MSGLPLKRVLGQEDRPVSLVMVLCFRGDRCVHSEQDGGVCQEVFGWSVEFLSTSGVDSYKRVNSMKLCLLVSCLSVSGSQDKKDKSCVSKCVSGFVGIFHAFLHRKQSCSISISFIHNFYSSAECL